MQTKVLPFAILVVVILASDELESARIGNIYDSMPTFKDLPSPSDKGDLRIQVAFSNFVEDILILTQVPETSIFEGHLQDDHEVPVVLIDTPTTKKRLIALNSINAPHCRYFDIDLETNNVECIHPTHNDQNTTDPVLKRRTASECPIETDAPIIRLGDDYPEGIFVKMLFIFGRNFYDEFDGLDGKSAEEHMEEVIKIVQNAYKDKTIKTELGTVINIVATKKIYEGDLDWYSTWDSSSIPRLYELTNEIGGEYDLYTYVRHSGSRGAWGEAGDIGSVCDKNGYRFNFNAAYGPGECENFHSTLDCTPTNRLLLTAETIAHETGHNLGMYHDHCDWPCNCAYRTHLGETCRGMMDYVDDGIAWSKCSMMDFSRYLAPKKSCLKDKI